MAVLTALAIGLTVASVVGTVVKAKAQKKAGDEQARAAEFEAQRAEYLADQSLFNAGQAEEQATDVTRRGAETEGTHRREVRRLIGTQRAGYATQGVDVSLGTPQAVQQQTEALVQSDLGRIRRNAAREALGYKAEAETLRTQAGFQRQEAGHIRTGGAYAKSAAKWNVASTILGGAIDTGMLATRIGPTYKAEKAPKGP